MVKKYDDIFSIEDKNNIINDYVKNLLSINDIMVKYNIRSRSYVSKVLYGYTRSNSEGNKIAHIMKPHLFKHSEKTKALMREKRLKFMKEHPEKTAWRRSNESYPEKMFKKYLEDRGYDKKHLIYREYSVFPYFIDFAFINEKIAIEIDGSQHLEEERAKKDKEKDKLLNSNGWKVIRITDKTIKTDWNSIDETLTSVLNKENNNTSTINVGVLQAPKIYYEKVERDENGYSLKEKERQFKQRVVKNRPSSTELLFLVKELPFTEIGRMYGVSDNTIRKWCKTYKIPYRKKDLKNK